MRNYEWVRASLLNSEFQIPNYSEGTNAYSQIQPHVAGNAFPNGSNLRRCDDVGAAQAAGRETAPVGWPQQSRPTDLMVARRGSQTDVPHHRLQARQAGHPGQACDD